MTKQEIIAQIAITFRDAVRAQVAKGNHLVWGNSDSVAVIEALCDQAYGLGEGFDAIRENVATVVNPSAFAQKLEELPDGTGKTKDGEADVNPDGTPRQMHPAYLRRPERGGRKRGATLAV